MKDQRFRESLMADRMKEGIERAAERAKPPADPNYRPPKWLMWLQFFALVLFVIAWFWLINRLFT